MRRCFRKCQITRTFLQSIFYLQFQTTNCKLIRQHSQCETSANVKYRCETWHFATNGSWTESSCVPSYALATGRRYTTGKYCTILHYKNGQVVYKPVLTVDKLYTSLHPKTAPCCHSHVSFLDVIFPEIWSER
jgi:hypothetical protein